MKSLKYIIVPALAGILFASCNTEAQGPTQAELDAQVEAKVKDATDKMKADCDAQIMNAAQLKKDSILVKMGKKVTPPAAPKAPAPPKSPVPPKTRTPKVVEPVKSEPVKANPKPTNVNDRGSNANNAPKNVNDRGSKAADAPKSVNDR